jgi:glycosyltransferase involved in cell wall biosynthesis
MACATPVIISPKVILGLEAVVDRDLIVGSDPADFAEKILKLIANPDLHQSIGPNGRAYVEEHHHWGRITEQLESIYQAAIRHPH